MYKSIYLIKKMDCPSEKSIIEMQLEPLKDIIKKMDFDFSNRKLVIFHSDKNEKITNLLNKTRLGSSLLNIENIDNIDFDNSKENEKQRKLLWTVFVINFGFFILECFFGIISNSMGLIADSLDMLSDASIYMVSLFAVGGSILLKKKIAKIAGLLQMFLAIFGLIEVIRRFIIPEESVKFIFMISIAFLAFLGNLYSMYLFTKNQSSDANMKASQICTSNDLISNTGIIISGILVYLLESNIPDLFIGAIVFTFVFRGSFKMIKLSY